MRIFITVSLLICLIGCQSTFVDQAPLDIELAAARVMDAEPIQKPLESKFIGPDVEIPWPSRSIAGTTVAASYNPQNPFIPNSYRVATYTELPRGE